MDQVALASRVAELEKREEFWKSAKVWVGSITGFLAVLLAIFEILQNRVEKEKDVSQERLSGLIREASNLEIARAMRQASDADARAGTANERAANAELRAAEASNQAASATLLAKKYEADIASSNAQAAEARSMAKGFEANIAKANQSAAEANATAERERNARLQLEQRLAPRSLTVRQSQQMVAALSEFKGAKVDLVIWGNVPEMMRIGEAIAENLTQAGWDLGGFQIAMAGAGSVQGIVVGAKADSDANTKRAANAVVLSLQSSGIDAGPWDFDQMLFPATSTSNGHATGAPIKIFIGNKP